MKVLHINNSYKTDNIGRHVKATEDALAKRGHESFVVFAHGNGSDEHHYAMESDLYRKINIIKTRFGGRHGFYNKLATKRAIEWIKSVDPDVIQLRNIHGHYINVEMLFDYLRESGKPVFWTFHDCWPITGHCAFFDLVGCEKWKTGCHDCECLNQYPITINDQSEWNWKKKKDLFTSLENLTVITPSQWLADIVSQSYLKNTQTIVIPNGIRLDDFSPKGDSFRRKNNIEDKTIVMGIAKGWTKRKGLDDIRKLSEMLDDSFVFVLVGVTAEQQKGFPESTVFIPKTSDVQELAEIYSSADILVNPTYEDNFPTVNIEALACGTPVITYQTGGSPESLTEKTGFVFRQGDVDGIYNVLVKKNFPDEKDCVEQARLFSSENRFNEYVDRYEKCLSDK